jgi:hypothetical protein
MDEVFGAIRAGLQRMRSTMELNLQPMGRPLKLPDLRKFETPTKLKLPGQGGQPAVPTGPHPIVAAPPQSPLGGATKPARPYAAMHAGAGKGPRMSFNQFVAQRDLQTPHYPYSQ